MSTRDAAIIGIADSEVGRLPGVTTLDLTARVASAAVADAGLDLGDVDGLITTVPLVGAFPRHAVAVAEYLGIPEQLRHCASVSLGGASALAGLLDAVRLVRTGTCRSVMVLAADTPRSGQDRSASVSAFSGMRHPAWEQPFGMLNVSAYALLAQAYLHRFGLEVEALASMPVAMREHAAGNPRASYREPLSTSDVAASRLVSSPLHLLECSPISDGAGAVIVGQPGSGSSTGKHIGLLGGSQGYVYDHVAYAGDLSRTGCSLSSRRALDAAAVGVDDVDVALLYDSYSITLALELEEIGICPPGGAPEFVASGGISLGGRMPTNTHGGLLSHAHCGGAAGIHHITESVRQLSGQAANQVTGATVALLHAEGGILSANCTAVLAR
ncbi:thiolase C-terminal domain-containing protein [Blastococcus capsensis]|uniref:thiolase C-terminal domain-containing protein n=1 Tax=Blastococcus capsensis TaxID=1564163 RepID=UPI002541556C|nr:thiolase family protein [Blastococcus capsensis]MDK3257780.1 thiolase family protein [Blastococcus capsensis]